MYLTTKIERLSLAYVAAVAAKAGYELIESTVDYDSVDGELRSASGLRPRIEFQAKGSTRSLLKDEHIAYPLSRKNYDDLRIETLTPRLLFVVLMPDVEDNWLSHSEDELVVRHCGYWLSLRGSAEVDQTNITVHIPRSQVLRPDQLAELMAKAEKGPEL
jgi:hypothetical protein